MYNVGGENERTNLDVIHHIVTRVAEVQKKDPALYIERVLHVADRPGHDFRYAMDITKIRALGWFPKTNFDAALTRLVERAACKSSA